MKGKGTAKRIAFVLLGIVAAIVIGYFIYTGSNI